MSSGQGFNVLEVFPLITEFIVDTGIGYLIILLFYPFLQVLITDPVPDQYYDLVNIFASSWDVVKGLSYVSIFVAYIIGIASRESLWIILSFFRKSGIERWVARREYKTLKWQFGKDIFRFKRVEKELIKKTPFSRVGEEDYTEFRTYLISAGGELQSLRKHWLHEEFLWLLFRRLYSFGLTFFLVYFLYGVFVISYLWHVGVFLDFSYIMAWIMIIVVSFFITFSFHRGFVFHGIAFTTVDHLLQKKFKEFKEREREKLSIYL